MPRTRSAATCRRASSKATYATANCSTGCWPVSTSCATSRRWSATASTPRTSPASPRTTTSAPRCCWPRWPARVCAGWCWRHRWSCTARVVTPARSTATWCRCPGGARTSMPAPSTRAARCATGRSAGTSWVRTRRSGRAAAMRSRRSRRSSTPTPGRRSSRAAAWRCATTTCTDRTCRRTRRTRVWRRSSAPRWRVARGRRCSRTAPRCATSCTSTTWRRPTWRRCSGWPTTAVGVTPYNVCSGHPTDIATMARLIAEEHGGPEPVVTGRYRAADVRHVVASPAAAVDGLGLPRGGPARRRAAGVRPRPAAAHPMTALPPGSSGRTRAPATTSPEDRGAAARGSSGRTRAPTIASPEDRGAAPPGSSGRTRAPATASPEDRGAAPRGSSGRTRALATTSPEDRGVG